MMVVADTRERRPAEDPTFQSDEEGAAAGILEWLAHSGATGGGGGWVVAK